MLYKKLITGVMLTVVLALGISMVSAQQGPKDGRTPSGLVEDYTGLTRLELRDAIMDGATLTELIEANGQSVDDFIAASIAEVETRLNEAVAAGRIDEAQAAERLAEFTERINDVDTLLDMLQDRRGNRPERPNVVGDLIEEYTGLSGQELRDALNDGTTIAALIEANGQSVDDFVTAATAAFETHLNNMVEAGRIDEDQAAERLATFAENLLSRERPDFGGRPDHRGGRGNGR